MASSLEPKVQASLGPEDDKKLLFHWQLALVQRNFEMTEDVSQENFLLVQGKLLTNTVPVE